MKTLRIGERDHEIKEMFDSIAFRYDFINHLLSFGIDRIWRKRAVKAISRICSDPGRILDVASGTGDLAIAAMRMDPVHITGIDISEKMLQEGRDKIKRLSLHDRIDMLLGDSQEMEFDDEVFDVVMVAFGVRNFSDPLRGLSEMYRVLRKKGAVMVLEFSMPSGVPFRQLYRFYFLRILPLIGRLFSRNDFAYTYLPGSVMEFPVAEQFIDLMEKAGFRSVKQEKLSGGIASIYTGLKF
ncbi:MAG: bifunctional demethylmenaquinone methyltransferase/2-methoxy-6-polyprenyl-1,4-benzoquinol methylase UbiE [Bacteroidales bacterium]|jgi:demethylmenaquinone methyltransferase/2-methoxy-6-polyprenyl-1,4-benzoquinol methylase|nr:bifunctional demethylmenaquinone methyltransferase/2-methoxy-6-polyprenyl-1,4-benzoquinol methylase UbiE [Bacteroidales bacterium]